MNKDIRLIGLDLDGTALQENATISPRVQSAIARAIQQGIAVLPATGRQLSGIPQAFLDIPGVRYALTSNGATVYDLARNTPIYEDCFSTSTAIDLLSIIEKHPCIPSAFIGRHSYTREKLPFDLSVINLPESILEYIRVSRNPVDNLADYIQKSALPVAKISILFGDYQVRASLRAELEERNDTCVTSSMPLNLEVNTATANKGAAILHLGELLGIKKEQIMAVGDSDNDLDMLRAVGYGVAMGNGTDSAKAVADFVTASCDDDGVAVAIEALLH